ncbi:hypothetical protein C8R45DRAFT_66244 [Mycena sanguinolenta]|nr:hypothetical protein C8R45DRAFT_66244 [Mycena sanguinolenta]
MPSPGHLALVTGLVSSSYFTFANIGASYFGIMPAIARGQTNLPVAERLILWAYFYDVSKFHMPTASIVSGLSLSVAAYSTRPGPLRNLLTAGAVAGFSFVIYTLVFLLRINNSLLASVQANSVRPMEEKEQKLVLDQLDSWRALHRPRIALGIITWVAATAGLLASGPIVHF